MILPSSLIDTVYRVLHRALKLAWRVFQPTTMGVKVIASDAAADQRISQTREGVNETAFQRSIHRPPVYGRFLVVPFVPSSLPIHRQE